MASNFKNFNNNSIEASVEVFYKDLKNILDYKDGATLILNDNLESELLNGNGKAYGLEVYLEKKTGKFSRRTIGNLKWINTRTGICRENSAERTGTRQAVTILMRSSLNMSIAC